MRSSIRVGKIAGVDVHIHFSLLGIIALVSWSLAQGLLPEQYPGWAVATYWLAGSICAVMLIASVLVHELAHSLVARARGFSVEGITLFLFGGVSDLKADSRYPRDEFIIAGVGPLTSFVLAGVFWLALAAFPNKDVLPAAVLWYLGFMNILLGAFNLIPAFPLDGGRVLRSAVWGATGSLSKATRVAALSGRGFGILMMALGGAQVLSGNVVGGLWFALIGWFLHGAAASTQHETAVETGVRGVRVSEAMRAFPVTIGPRASLAEAVYGSFLQHSSRSLPVSERGELVGIITLADIRDVPQSQWQTVTVAERMTPAPLWTVRPGDDLADALNLLGRHSIDQAPVIEQGRLVGVLSRADIIRHLNARRGKGA